jgi:hypothetical protein
MDFFAFFENRIKPPDMPAINPKQRSAAFISTAPPSELPCQGRSNFNITGLVKIAGSNKRSVAVESVNRKPLNVP